MLPMPPETVPGLDTVDERVSPPSASQETANLTQFTREIIPLSAHATGTWLRISMSPTRSTRPISAHVREPDGTAWRVLTMTVDGVSRPYGDSSYPTCRGNCWIDLEVECPHDRPPTDASPVELRGVLLCEASDLPVSAGDTERDRQWSTDFRKPRGARKLSSGEWETTFRGDVSPLPTGISPQDSLTMDMDTLTNPGSSPTPGPAQREDASTRHVASQTLWTRVPRMVPSRAYGRRTIALRHPTRISRGVPTTVHGVLPVEIDALRPDRFQFAVTKLDDWAVSDFRVHGVSQVRTVRETALKSDDALPGLLSAFLNTELARTLGHTCLQLKLSIVQPAYARAPVKVWDRGEKFNDLWDSGDLAAELLQTRDLAAEILRTAKNLAESYDEESLHFEVRGSQGRISFQIPCKPEDDTRGLSQPPRLHPRDFVESLVDGGCAPIQAQMTFNMDVVYLGPRADEEFCCLLSGPHVPSERDPRLTLRGGRCVPLPMPSYTSVERLAQATVSTSIDRPIELVDLVVRDAADWVIGDVSVNGVPWLPWNMGTAELLADCLRCGLRRNPLYKSRVIPQGSQVSMSVLYVGPQESAAFWGCLVGRAPLGEDDAPARDDWNMTLSTSTGDLRLRSGDGSALVTEYLLGPPVRIEAVTVASPQDWVIEDVLLDGRSVLARAGSFAGEALGEMGQLGMHLGVARERIELLVSYVGNDEGGAAFRCTIRGSSEASLHRPGGESAQESVTGVGWDPWLE